MSREFAIGTSLLLISIVLVVAAVVYFRRGLRLHLNPVERCFRRLNNRRSSSPKRPPYFAADSWRGLDSPSNLGSIGTSASTKCGDRPVQVI
ncbi:hypothetical protein M0657_000072 [Pyricularia oryzae]|nr:hypothetical protein M9X92_000156 [Pyricularia oryzae]KAI7932763.1 hypothetical protein M0657_000072 [Pyricularia oryzae]